MPHPSRDKILKFVREYKESNPCTDCGTHYPYWVMEFDHLGDKVFNIGDFRRFTTSLSRVKAEIQKCELVCSNCHRHRTYMRMQE